MSDDRTAQVCFCDRPVAECTMPHCKRIAPPDPEWLRRKVETDPDIDCEARADAMSDKPNPNPPHIWLAPICEDDTAEGRYWSTEAKDCEDCEEKAVKYIRADLAADEIERLREENRKLREAIPRQILFYS